MFKFKKIMHRDMLDEESVLEMLFKNLFMLLSWCLGHFQIPLYTEKVGTIFFYCKIWAIVFNHIPKYASQKYADSFLI